MSTKTDGPSAVPGVRRRGGRLLGAGLVVAGTFLLVGCDMNIVGTGAAPEVTDRFTFTVKVTNTGAGSGFVRVSFPVGNKQNPCPDFLGPGESCAPFVRLPAPGDSADLNVGAAAGHRFTGWVDGAGQCTGRDTECTVTSQSNDRDVTIDLTLAFDPQM